VILDHLALTCPARRLHADTCSYPQAHTWVVTSRMRCFHLTYSRLRELPQTPHWLMRPARSMLSISTCELLYPTGCPGLHTAARGLGRSLSTTSFSLIQRCVGCERSHRIHLLVVGSAHDVHLLDVLYAHQEVGSDGGVSQRFGRLRCRGPGGRPHTLPFLYCYKVGTLQPTWPKR
jgi:hypothetical protein